MSGEFHRQTGDSPQEANWEGWTPPWMRREGEDPRGWRGPRGPFGHWRGFGGPPGFGFGFGFGPGRHWDIPDELLALRAEAAEVARLFAIASRGAFENKERLSQLRSFLDRSRKELSDMIYGSAQGQATSEGESASGSSEVGQA
jgi:hypothetical protein